MPIDGELRSARVIREMVAPLDQDVFGFNVNDKKYELHVYYLYGGPAYVIYEDRKRLAEPQHLKENVLDFARRAVENLGGTALRRL